MVDVGFRDTAFGWLSGYVAGGASPVRSAPSDQARGGLVTNRRLISCVALTAGALGMIGAAQADDKPVLIGFAIAQTGWAVPFDTGFKTAEIAIEEINAKGGLLGRKLVTAYCDTKSDREQGAKCGQEMVEKGADFIVVTCDYDFGAPAALAAARAGKIAWSLCAGDPKMGVQGIGPLAFSGAEAAQLQGLAIAEWGLNKKGWKAGYMLLDSSVEYDKSVCYGFELGFNAVGGKIVGRDTFKNDDPSIATQITRLKALNPAPDVIALCSYTPGGASAVRQIRAAGINTPIASDNAMDGGYWLSAVPDLNNFFYASYGSVVGGDPRQGINDLREKYVSKVKEQPPISQTYMGFSMMQLYQAAVEKAQTLEPKAVVAAIETFKDQPTVEGPFSFTHDLHIQNKRQFTIMGINNGKLEAIELWNTTTPLTMGDLFRKK
jgi:branched-chain amino acid transport system substrate-binding protein